MFDSVGENKRRSNWLENQMKNIPFPLTCHTTASLSKKCVVRALVCLQDINNNDNASIAAATAVIDVSLKEQKKKIQQIVFGMKNKRNKKITKNSGFFVLIFCVSFFPNQRFWYFNVTQARTMYWEFFPPFRPSDHLCPGYRCYYIFIIHVSDGWMHGAQCKFPVSVYA